MKLAFTTPPAWPEATKKFLSMNVPGVPGGPPELKLPRLLSVFALRSLERQLVDVAGTNACPPDIHRLAPEATKKFLP